MIAYKCDICGEEVNDRNVAKVDGKEYDLCVKCHAKTVGKLIGSGKGRFVFEPVPTPVFVPYIYYYPPVYVQRQPAFIPSWPTIFCDRDNVTDGTCTINNPAAPTTVPSITTGGQRFLSS